ncbi:MAG: succinylglutamate desuccinylase [Chromatiaceae bacterium]|nr:MAG: succinylglutamate desuccinylase [Chromatiaceae bacterium]
MADQSNTPANPVHDLGPADRRPRVALVNPGGEANVNGQFVLGRLSAFLKSLETGESARGRLRKRILIAPCPHADQADSVAEQTRQAFYRVEVGHGTDGMDALPQVSLMDPSDDERASACLFGLAAVIEHSGRMNDDSPWLPAWQEAGGENLYLKAGRVGELQPALCERLFRALVNFLTHAEVIQEISLAEEEDDLHYFGQNQIFELTSDARGLFVFRQDPGRWLHGGDLIGYLYDRDTGALIKEFKTPVSGLLTSIRRNPLVETGSPVATVSRLEREG